MKSPQPLEGIIFDLDGTLVDSRLDFTTIRAELACPEGVGVLEFIDGLPADRQHQAHQVVKHHERQGAERARWMPGARQCLQQARDQGLPTAILTRNAREIAQLTMARLDIEVDVMLAREDCAPKPSPQGLLMIAAQWGCDPQRLVYVGDFIYDLQAARRAGMAACYYDPTDSGRFVGDADWHIRHFDELLAGD